MDRLPSEEGVKFTGPHIDARGIMEKHPLRIGNAESLSAMSKDYEFFTPAILYLHAQFTDAPLIDCVYTMRKNVRFYFHRFKNAIFRGLEARSGDVDWNHALWAVEKPFWQEVHDFLASIVLMHSTTDELMRIGSQSFSVLDPLAVDKQTIFRLDTEALPITAFGINGSKFRAGFVYSPRLLPSPILRFFEPTEDVQVYAKALKDGKNPVNARSDFLKRKEANRLKLEEDKRHEQK